MRFCPFAYACVRNKRARARANIGHNSRPYESARTKIVHQTLASVAAGDGFAPPPLPVGAAPIAMHSSCERVCIQCARCDAIVIVPFLRAWIKDAVKAPFALRARSSRISIVAHTYTQCAFARGGRTHTRALFALNTQVPGATGAAGSALLVARVPF